MPPVEPHGRSNAGWEAALVVLVAAALVVSVLPALRDFDVPGAPPVLVAAALLPVALAVVTVRSLRRGPGVSYTASGLALIVGLVAVSGGHVGRLASSLAHGPERLLTETLPLSGGRVVLAPLLVLTWVAAAVDSELLLRRGGGSGRLAAALGVPLALWLACFALATAAPGRSDVVGPVLLVLLAGAAVVHHRADAAPTVRADPLAGAPAVTGRPRPGRRAAGPLAALAAASVVAGGLYVATGRMSGAPATPHRSTATGVPVLTDPVDLMAELRDGNPGSPASTELHVVVSAPWSGYLASAYLDTYDGGQWSLSGTFDPTGGRVPVPAGAATTGPRVVQTVTIERPLPVPLLPAIDRPVKVSGPAVLAEPRTGMLLPRAASSRITYTVVSDADGSTLGEVPTADGIDSSQAAAADTAIPPDTSADIAETVRYLAGISGHRPAPTVSFLQAAAQALRQHAARVDPGRRSTAATSPPHRSASGGPTTTVPPVGVDGTSLAQVVNAVTVNRSATPEQFATLFVMAARYLGVPARLVTGFRVAPSSQGGPLPAGAEDVTTRQAWAWAEIPVSGLGWVVVDPTPDATTGTSAPPPEAVQAPATTVAPAHPDALPVSGEGGHALAPPRSSKAPHRHHQPAWLDALVGGAGLATLLCVAVPLQAALRRAARRRARRSGGNRERVVGAWLEVLDAAGRAGVVLPAGATGREVAAELGHHFGPGLVAPALSLASAADAALFAPGRATADDTADRAWSNATALRAGMFGLLDRRQRIRASLRAGG